MEIIQVVIEPKLLRAADRAAQRAKLNRSALIRDALREHLRSLAVRELEERDRAGYRGRKPADSEWAVWEPEAAWPD